MAAEDWIPYDFIDEEEYEDGPRYRRVPQAEFQDDDKQWRTSQKYIPVERLENFHLLCCIHMMERKSLKEYDPVPKVYKRMIKEAKKRKLIKR